MHTSNHFHFAISGRAAAVDRGLIADVVKNYPADVMVRVP